MRVVPLLGGTPHRRPMSAIGSRSQISGVGGIGQHYLEQQQQQQPQERQRQQSEPQMQMQRSLQPTRRRQRPSTAMPSSNRSAVGIPSRRVRPSTAIPGMGRQSWGASQSSSHSGALSSQDHRTSVADVIAQPKSRTLRPFKRRVAVAKGAEKLRPPVDFVSVAMARGLSAELAGTEKSVAVWLQKRTGKPKDKHLDRARELLFGRSTGPSGMFGAPPRTGSEFRPVRRQRPFVTRVKQSKHKKRSIRDAKRLRVAALDSALERECERRMSHHRRALGLLPPK